MNKIKIKEDAVEVFGVEFDLQTIDDDNLIQLISENTRITVIEWVSGVTSVRVVHHNIKTEAWMNGHNIQSVHADIEHPQSMRFIVKVPYNL